MEFHLEHFDGPLDLLLHLIAKNKVSICDIPIAVILEQYMAVLQEAGAMDLDVAGDFIAMAAQLLYIKSRMLLPRSEEEAQEDPRAGLVEMLLEYQRIKETAPFFREKGETGRDIFIREQEQTGQSPRQYHQTVTDLVRAAGRMLNKARQRVPPSASAFAGIAGREPVPVEGRITIILRLFLQRTRLRFLRLFDNAASRSEIVATFLAVLELSKTRRIRLEGEGEETELILMDGKGE